MSDLTQLFFGIALVEGFALLIIGASFYSAASNHGLTRREKRLMDGLHGRRGTRQDAPGRDALGGRE